MLHDLSPIHSGTELYCTVLYCTVLHCTTLYCTTLCFMKEQTLNHSLPRLILTPVFHAATGIKIKCYKQSLSRFLSFFVLFFCNFFSISPFLLLFRPPLSIYLSISFSPFLSFSLFPPLTLFLPSSLPIGCDSFV